MTWPVVRGLTRTMLKVYVIFSVLILLLFAGVWLVLMRTGDLTNVITGTAEVMPVRFFLLAMGAVLASTHLPVFVAYGVTRRDFLRGGLIFCALSSAGFAVLVLCGYFAEAIAIRQAGLAGTLEYGLPVTSAADALAVLARATPLNFGYMCAGWAAATTIYRWGILGGLVVIPLLVAPVLLAEGFASFPFIRSTLLSAGLEPEEHALAMAVSSAIGTLLTVGLLAGLVIALVRRMPLRPRKA